MGKPDDIPEDVWVAANAEAGLYVEWLDAGNSTGSLSAHAVEGLTDSFARAILAERERCAKVAEGLFPASSTGRKVATKTQQIVHAAGNRIALAVRKGGPA